MEIKYKIGSWFRLTNCKKRKDLTYVIMNTILVVDQNLNLKNFVFTI
jgi:hypothetical protein